MFQAQKPLREFDVFVKGKDGWKFTERVQGSSIEQAKSAFLSANVAVPPWHVTAYPRK
jgi:hypothetical protein